MPGKYVVVSGVLFGVIAVVQAVRALNQWPVQVEGFAVPVWVSWVAMVVAGSLCVWAFRSGHK
jgi:sterol desaturase/sphingolipid hydroxylase (fatty acid hydroxylase superfamily)